MAGYQGQSSTFPLKKIQRFIRFLFEMKDKFHFTSYWRYCFLHSGVIWDERCSANFILPEQVSPKTSGRSESGCPLARRRDFCYFSQLGWINMRRTPLPLHSTSGWSRTVRSEQIPSRIVSEEEAALDSVPFLNVAVSVVCQGRWHCLSDFASSLPGHVCGHCGPPSR